MIIDVRTHLSTLEQWGPFLREAFVGVWGDDTGIDLHATPERHINAMANVDRAIVFGINKPLTPGPPIHAHAESNLLSVTPKSISFAGLPVRRDLPRHRGRGRPMLMQESRIP